MSDSSKCPRCANELPAGFPPGICPVCLMQQGLSPSTLNSRIGAAISEAGRRKSWVPPSPAELAPRFPQLEIVELLGQGGMGAVYKVRQRDLDRWAALKVLPDDVAHDPNFSERFLREARALALLGHQHIVTVYEFGQRDGVFFLLMEYIDGVTLRQAIRARGVTDRESLAIVAQICEALQFAHEEGVVHRDIKPENILIDRRGRVKIADFGLAKLLGRAFEVPTLTGTHQVMGTPVYMAPEQMEGTRGVDHRADIFSLGVVFYELLTGELPLGRFAPPSQKYKLDVRLDDVVMRTLEKEPERRYQQASDVKVDVESIRNPQPMMPHTQIAPPPAKLEKPRRRWKWTKRFAALILLSMTLFGAFAIAAERNRLTNLVNQLSNETTYAQSQLASANQQIHEAHTQIQMDAARRAAQPPAQPAAVVKFPDPNEQNAIVQFPDSGPILNPEFAKNELRSGPPSEAVASQKWTAHRNIVNSAMATVHKEFLAMERQHSDRQVKPDHSQVTIVRRFPEDLKRLEHWFWKSIDSQLAVDEQKFLRSNLPLFANLDQPLPTIQQLEKEKERIEPLFQGASMTSSTSRPPFQVRTLLSTVEQTEVARPGNSNPLAPQQPVQYVPVLRQAVRLVNFNPLAPAPDPAAPEKTAEIPHAMNLRYMQLLGWNQDQTSGKPRKPGQRDIFPIRITISRHGNWYRWSIEIPQIQSPTLGQDGPVDEPAELEFDVADSGYDPELPSGLRRFWKDVANDDLDTFRSSVGEGLTISQPLQPVRESRHPRPADEPFSDDLPPADSPSRSVPFDPPTPQEIEVAETADRFDSRDEEQFPRLTRRDEVDLDEAHPIQKAHAANPLSALMSTLEVAFDPEQGNEGLRNEVKACLQLNIPRDTRLAIHRKFVEFLGSKKSRRHTSELEYHANESLKYERDPVNRGALYAILGRIAEIHDNDPASFIESRAEASQWYLKGYKELLPFRLPENAPELPAVDAFQEADDDDGEVNPERTAAKLRYENQTNHRKQAEFTAQLVERRNHYIGRLRELFKSLHDTNDKNATGMARFYAVADPVIQNNELIGMIWNQIESSKPASPLQDGRADADAEPQKPSNPTFLEDFKEPSFKPVDESNFQPATDRTVSDPESE